MASALGVRLITVDAPELVGQYYGDSEAKLRQVMSPIFKAEIPNLNADFPVVGQEILKAEIPNLKAKIVGD